MALETIAGAAAAYAGKAAFKKLAEEIYSQVKTSSGRKLKQWSTEARINQLFTKIGKVRKVKTLWQIDKAVDLHSFYCPSHAIVRRARRQVRSFDDIDVGEHVLIHGIAGQGKSMLMRYLCATELVRGKYIPVFVELRRLQDRRSLNTEIFASFKALDLDVDGGTFAALAGSGRLLLLLDGFDEVAEAQVQRVIGELEDLALNHENITIVVSSRPDSGLEVSPHFQVVRLDDLKGEEYKAVIYKLLDDTRTADDVIDQIESHEGVIKECLSTPLMVTMLVIIYKSFAAIPAQFSEFYDSLFQVLLQRHDGVKPGFRRQRRCSINDTQYRHIFEVMCFTSKRIKSTLFSEGDIANCAAEALKLSKVDEDEDRFITDIIKITCLIVKEGGQCRFLHKSVQEYYAASMIRRKPDVWIHNFYSKMIDLQNVRPWQQELAFLSEIDSYRYNRFYLLPLTLRLFGCEDGMLLPAAPTADAHTVKKVMGEISVGLDLSGSRSTPQLAYHASTDPLTRRFISSLWTLDCREVIEAINAGKIDASKFVSDSSRAQIVRVSIGTIVDSGLLHTELIALVNRRFKEIYKQAVTIQRSLVEQESDDLLNSLLSQ